MASKVEAYFEHVSKNPVIDKRYEKIKTIVVDNYAVLGQLAALRFLEWVCQNPSGVISLPTGKTPEFFIKWTQYYLENWNKEIKTGILKKIGFDSKVKPNMKSLHFIQMDEFFPIDPNHQRAFQYFVRKYYIKGFGLDPKKAKLIDTYNINKAPDGIRNVEEAFPDGVIDLSLRTKRPNSDLEFLQKNVINMFDHYCENYEEHIEKLGGIGFFLGGIGPDGHIAFNIKGSSHHSNTRLDKLNYESQAAAAGDLGGIEVVRKKAVITVGLETITYKPDVVAIIFASGEAKAKVVAKAIENKEDIQYPASCLQKLENSRFYLTKSASVRLKERNITKKKPLESIRKSIDKKIRKGLSLPKKQVFLHTAPHHDDIELAYFPLLHHLVRSEENSNHFCYCTSGFTSVTNDYARLCLEYIKDIIVSGILFGQVEKKELANIKLAQNDITGYLNAIAGQNVERQAIYIAAHVVREVFYYLKTDQTKKVLSFIEKQIYRLNSLDPGSLDPEEIVLIKSWLREFEAELVWAHFGIGIDKVHHLRLEFYTGHIFPEYPNYKRDVLPVLKLMEKIKPTIITVALDPEGTGPDTHYKTLIAVAQAIDEYVKKSKNKNIRIWGYRNVWSRFSPEDASFIVPVSLNSFAVLHNMFNSCFLSQKSASFPSYELDGTFSQLAQKIWVKQHNDLVKIMGDKYFYQDPNPMLRRSYGAIYIKDMSYPEFFNEMKKVRRLLDAKKGLQS